MERTDLTKLSTFVGTVALLVANAAFAHEGVKNPAVMARMNGMSTIADNMKTVGNMAKGVTQFDVGTAQQALSAIALQASQTPALFQDKEDDPKSEAKLEIWDNFEDFTAKAVELETLANQLAPAIESRDDLRNVLFLMGENCKSCHGAYKE